MVLPSSGSSVFIRTSRTNRSYTEEMERQLDNLENNFVHKYTDSDLGEDISGMPEFFYGNGKKDSDMSDEDLLGHMVDLAKMEGHPSMDGLLSSGSGFDTSIF